MPHHCAVCLEAYASQRLPKALACGHTLCLPCLNALYQQQQARLKCPTCRKETAVRPQMLPTIFDLLGEPHPEGFFDGVPLPGESRLQGAAEDEANTGWGRWSDFFGQGLHVTRANPWAGAHHPWLPLHVLAQVFEGALSVLFAGCAAVGAFTVLPLCWVGLKQFVFPFAANLFWLTLRLLYVLVTLCLKSVLPLMLLTYNGISLVLSSIWSGAAFTLRLALHLFYSHTHEASTTTSIIHSNSSSNGNSNESALSDTMCIFVALTALMFAARRSLREAVLVTAAQVMLFMVAPNLAPLLSVGVCYLSYRAVWRE